MKLYKYSKIEHLENLSENKIYFSNVGSLNDAYEGALSFDVCDKMRPLFYKRFYPEVYNCLFVDENLHQQIINRIIENTWEEYKKELGVASFSTINNSHLMWAHYADKQYRMCLEFNSKCFPFNNAKPITYSPKIYSIKVLNENQLRQEYFDEQYLKICYQKSSEWKYEKEWRINNKADICINYEPNALTAIYLGYNVKLSDCKRIFEATNHVKDLKYYKQMLHRNGNYQIAFEKVSDSEKQKILNDDFTE